MVLPMRCKTCTKKLYAFLGSFLGPIEGIIIHHQPNWEQRIFHSYENVSFVFLVKRPNVTWYRSFQQLETMSIEAKPKVFRQKKFFFFFFPKKNGVGSKDVN